MCAELRSLGCPVADDIGSNKFAEKVFDSPFGWIILQTSVSAQTLEIILLRLVFRRKAQLLR